MAAHLFIRQKKVAWEIWSLLDKDQDVHSGKASFLVELEFWGEPGEPGAPVHRLSFLYHFSPLFWGFKHKRNLTGPERRVDRMSLADASSGASDDTAVTGAIFLRGPSPTEGHVTPGEEKPGCGHAHRL